MSRAQNRTDSLIGAGVRIDGDITFTGVLRILGEVRGAVTCDGGSDGTAVVAQSGNVDGIISAPHIVVGGTVHGPLRAAETIEIQQSGHVVGDASYQGIGIYAGGVIEGSLMPRMQSASDSSPLEPRVQVSAPPAVGEHFRPPANMQRVGSSNAKYRLGGWGKMGGAVVLLIAVIPVVLVSRDPTPVAPPPLVDLAPQAVVVAKETSTESLPPQLPEAKPQAPQPAPVASAPALPEPLSVAVQSPAKDVVIAPAPIAVVEPKRSVPVSPPVIAAANSEPVVVVHGDNPDKSATAVFVISEDPVVLFRKKREDTGEGTRIELLQGGQKSITIAGNELLRVAKSGDVRLFYQGRKVPPNTIANGSWIRFEPRLPGPASDKQ